MSQYAKWPAINATAIWGGITGTLSNQADLQAALNAKQNSLGYTPVPDTRTVNGHALSADVTVTAADVGLGNVTNVAQIPLSYLSIDGTLSANSDSLVPSQKAVKTYADSLALGLIWQQPVADPCLADDSLSAPPVGTHSTVFILSAAGSGAWTGFVAGTAVQFFGGIWVNVLGRPVQVGDRFGVTMEDGSGSEGGGLVGKHNYIAQITNATPGAITYAFTAPTNNMAFTVLASSNSDHAGKGYTYSASLVTWVNFSGSVNITAGVALSFSGNTLNVRKDTTTITVNGSNQLTLASGAAVTSLGFTPAHSGANSDITSITGLSTPLAGTQGGTGASSASNSQVLCGPLYPTVGSAAPSFKQLSTGDILPANVSNSPNITQLEEQLNHALSSGATDGALITDNGNGTVNISSSTTYVRTASAVSSLTRSSQVATITTTLPHDYNPGDYIHVKGADQAQYNGYFYAITASGSTITYAVTDSPATPATGTIIVSDDAATLNLTVIPSITNLTMVDHSTNYIYADWNFGSPTYGTSTNIDNMHGLSRARIWTVQREGTTLWIADNRATNVDTANKSDILHHAVDGFAHAELGTVLTASGTRNIAVSAGSFFYGLNQLNNPAMDTSTGDTFTYASTANGGTSWTYTTGQTQIDNAQYDALGSGLTSLTAGNYGVHWVYLMHNSVTPCTLMVLYGQGDYTKSQAFTAQEPTIKPQIITNGGSLIGRIVVQQGASAFTSVYCIFTPIFPNTSPDLNSLSDVLTTSPTLGNILAWNGTKWVNSVSANASAGAGVVFYKTTPVITATGTGNTIQIGTLSNTPVTTAEQTTAGSTTVGVTTAFAARVYDQTLGRTSIPAGLWAFSIWASINSGSGTSILTEQVYQVTPALTGTITVTGTGTTRTVTASAGTPFATSLIDASATNTVASYLQTPSGLYQISARTTDTVVTIITPSGYVNDTATTFSVFKKLFGVSAADFVGTGTQLLSIPITTQPAFTVAATDKIGTIEFLFSSSGTRNITVYYNGTTHNSNFQAPITVLHDQLPGVQGGTAGEEYHLTAAEYTGSGTGVFARVNSPVFTTPNIGNATGNVSGTASNLSGTPALPNGTTATTQSAADNSTKLATTAYADRMLPLAGGTMTGTLVIKATTNTNTADTDGTTITFDLSASDLHSVTLGGNRTLALSNAATGKIFYLRLQQDGTGSRTVTWFTTIKWAGGAAPTLTTSINKADAFVFVCTGTNTYDGFIVGQNI
jgi:hypothetical protein